MNLPLKYPDPYLKVMFRQFRKNRLGMVALSVFILFVFIGLYAPFFASSKPAIVLYQDHTYFPLFRYLFYTGFYTKPIDLFYNILMFTLPVALLGTFFLKNGKKSFFICMGVLQIGLFLLFLSGIVKDPSSNQALVEARKQALGKTVNFREDPLLAHFSSYPSWDFEMNYMTDYAKLNILLTRRQRKEQHERLQPYLASYVEKTKKGFPTLWEVDRRNAAEEKKKLASFVTSQKPSYEQALTELPALMSAYRPFSHDFLMAKLSLENAEKSAEKNKDQKTQEALHKAQVHFDDTLKKVLPTRQPLEQARSLIQDYQNAAGHLAFLEEREEWIESESQKLRVLIPAFFRQFHWEDDAGGQQSINQYIPWWELSRINRKDLVAGLLFGIRVSLVIGITAVLLSLLIGIPMGMVAGYFGGKSDILICRLIEIWEAMPTFFMLLLIVAITQSKSIFLVIAVLGIFGWTGLGRFMRGEVLKQRNLSYVLACHSQGFRHNKIMFSHILPNAIPPILTLLPFSMMAAITSEAGISFLGLGEEGSTSWGVLMAEGRSVFPGESYLLWPPAILLTVLLISIALVGDGLRDAIDPKMRT